MKLSTPKRVLATLVLLSAAILLFTGGCNMMHGAGKDIEKAGESMQ